MFTSIALLRASDAIKTRVDSVERYLKRTMTTYSTESFFPMVVVAKANNFDDFLWVAQNKDVHMNMHKCVHVAMPNNFVICDDFDRRISSLNLSVDASNRTQKTRWADFCLNRIDSCLSDLTKTHVSWKDTTVTYAASELATSAPAADDTVRDTLTGGTPETEDVDPVEVVLDLFDCLSKEQQEVFLGKVL